jgi:ATP-dependent RNA helicase RhlE
MAPEIERITNTFLQNPARIEVARQATASETIDQSVVMFKASRRERADSEKRAVLRTLIDSEGEKLTNAIIFCNRKTDVDICAKSLKKYGYDAAAIHGDLDQSQRTRTLEAFRSKELRLLVASDVAARGLDIPSVSHVFNFDVPGHAEDYVHRIGRTGRAGRDGKAITICNKRDDKAFAAVETLIQKTITRIENPVATKAVDTPRGDDEKPKRTRSRKRDEDKVKAAAQDSEPAQDQSADTPAAPVETGPKTTDRHRKSGKGVVGMGDHLPSFIAKSFDERRAS